MPKDLMHETTCYNCGRKYPQCNGLACPPRQIGTKGFMKIIFLDFDGVLNNTITPGAWALNDEDAILKEKVALINQIVDATGARVVVSSMWRLDTSVVQLQKLLDKRGATFVIIGKTPKKRERWAEILDWIEDNIENDDQFVIIDDSLIAGWGFSKNFVNTDPDVGITDADAQKAIGILNR